MLRSWKSAQYAASGFDDIFAEGWIRALQDRLLAVDTPAFAGLLTSVYAGDTLVAAHLGMRSATVMHWWWPTYDRDFSKYSPGSILLIDAARALGDAGVTSIELGTGEDTYKPRVANTHTEVAAGVIDAHPALRTARVTAERTRARLAESELLRKVRDRVRPS
jgi:CelD/BcsL family acetyltransferase involved in cellulose biosynthesis